MVAWLLLPASGLRSLPARRSASSTPDAGDPRAAELLVDATQGVRQTSDGSSCGRRKHASTPANAQRIASLYAVQAQAYSILELDAEPPTAAKGLAIRDSRGDPVHLDLLSTYAENVYDEAGMDAAMRPSRRRGLASRADRSPTLVC